MYLSTLVSCCPQYKNKTKKVIISIIISISFLEAAKLTILARFQVDFTGPCPATNIIVRGFVLNGATEKGPEIKWLSIYDDIATSPDRPFNRYLFSQIEGTL